jgi:small-conductance mechanosensitive channel
MTGPLPAARELATATGIAAGTYVVLIASAHLLSRVRGVRFGRVYHAFALAAGLFAAVWLLHWPSPDRAVLLRHLGAATLVLAAFPLLSLLNRALWVTTDPHGTTVEAPRVLADLTGVLLVTATVLATLQFIYRVQVPGLLAGSGVVALILGLGMQDQLHNLFAGVSLHFSKPFKIGDWLLIDGQHARVVGISWRDTRLITSDDVVIEIGNSELLKQTLTNFHQPQPRHAVRATIGLHYSAPPARVQALLKQTAQGVPGVCPAPEPQVYLKEFADSAIIYEIKVWIDDHAVISRVLSDVRSHCWYAVNRAGIEIPYPQLTLHRAAPADPRDETRDAAVTALQAGTVLSFLSPAQLRQLVSESAVLSFAPGEGIIQQDEPGASLFLLIRGRVEVRIRRDGRVVAVAKLGAGECFGEMSLLAGEARSATIVTLTEVTAVEIPKPAFAAIVRANPEILGRLSELLAQRQQLNAHQPAPAEANGTAEQSRHRIRAKLRAFFELG